DGVGAPPPRIARTSAKLLPEPEVAEERAVPAHREADPARDVGDGVPGRAVEVGQVGHLAPGGLRPRRHRAQVERRAVARLGHGPGDRLAGPEPARYEP